MRNLKAVFGRDVLETSGFYSNSASFVTMYTELNRKGKEVEWGVVCVEYTDEELAREGHKNCVKFIKQYGFKKFLELSDNWEVNFVAMGVSLEDAVKITAEIKEDNADGIEKHFMRLFNSYFKHKNICIGSEYSSLDKSISRIEQRNNIDAKKIKIVKAFNRMLSQPPDEKMKNKLKSMVGKI